MCQAHQSTRNWERVQIETFYWLEIASNKINVLLSIVIAWSEFCVLFSSIFYLVRCCVKCVHCMGYYVVVAWSFLVLIYTNRFTMLFVHTAHYTIIFFLFLWMILRPCWFYYIVGFHSIAHFSPFEIKTANRNAVLFAINRQIFWKTKQFKYLFHFFDKNCNIARNSMNYFLPNFNQFFIFIKTSNRDIVCKNRCIFNWMQTNFQLCYLSI